MHFVCVFGDLQGGGGLRTYMKPSSCHGSEIKDQIILLGTRSAGAAWISSSLKSDPELLPFIFLSSSSSPPLPPSLALSPVFVLFFLSSALAERGICVPAQSRGLKTEVSESERPTVVDFLWEQPSPSHAELQSLHTALYIQIIEVVSCLIF